MSARVHLGADQLQAIATPAKPPAGAVLLYAKGDGNIYKQTSDGVEIRLNTGAQAPLSALSDTRISNPANGNFLRYDSTNAAWANVVPNSSMVGLGSVDNTADVDKPVSTAQAAADALREPAITPGGIGTFWRGDKNWASQPVVNVRVATTINITLSGSQFVDNVNVVAGDLVLVKNQTLSQNNGVYTVAAGTWARTPGLTTASALAGLIVTVNAGGTQRATWQLTNFTSSSTVGSSPQTWNYLIDSGNTSYAPAVTDTGWVTFTPGLAASGPFSTGTPSTPTCRYRVIGNRVTLQVQRTATSAVDNSANPNYGNFNILAVGAIPAAVLPAASGPQIEIRGRFDDVPITGVVYQAGVTSAGAVVITGGGLRAYGIGDVIYVQAEWYTD